MNTIKVKIPKKMFGYEIIEIVDSINNQDSAFFFKLFTTVIFSDKFGLKNIFKNLCKSSNNLIIILFILSEIKSISI
jgi:hypothetical protein